jgi:Caspase domain
MDTSSRRAVIVGIDNYNDTAITNLTGAKNDAEELCQHLVRYGNFKVEDHHLLINEKASAQNIRRAISDLLWKTDECELSLFYFSGHGLTDAYGNGYIAPYDMVRNYPLVFGIKMQEIRDLMLAAKNKKAVMIMLDCCYSGIASDGDKAVVAASASAVDDCLTPLNEIAFHDSGRFVMTSAGSDERSREIADCLHMLGNQPPHPHGAFTFQILEGLDGRASVTGQEITIGSLFDCVTESFTDSDQHRPKLYGSGVGSLNILLCRASRQAELEKRVQDIWDLLSDDTDLFALFRAIRDLEKVLADSPGLQGALDLRDLIDKQLARQKGPAVQALMDNMLDLSMGCKETFGQLQSVICRGKIDFVAITCQENRFRNLILSLFRLASGETELEILQSELAAYETAKASSKLHPSQDTAKSR